MNREIKRAGSFKDDFKRQMAGPNAAVIEEMLPGILDLLAADQTPPAELLDHSLKGNWKGHRDLHLLPDLVLIYRKLNPHPHTKLATLELVRLGTHSQLFKK